MGSAGLKRCSRTGLSESLRMASVSSRISRASLTRINTGFYWEKGKLLLAELRERGVRREESLVLLVRLYPVFVESLVRGSTRAKLLLEFVYPVALADARPEQGQDEHPPHEP